MNKLGKRKKKKEGEPLIGADLGQRHTKNGIKKKGRKRKRSNTPYRRSWSTEYTKNWENKT
jgi:hypothetical protein